MIQLLNKKLIFLISFIAGGILFFGIGVFATTSIDSKDVVYDGSSGLKSANVQDALDEVHSLTTKGNAIESAILSGAMALVQGSLVTGSMPNNGNLDITLNPGDSYNIPLGYTSGGTIEVNPNINTETYTPTVNGEALDMGVIISIVT